MTRSKGAVFHFPYALFTGPDLDPLMFFISEGKAFLAFGRSQWVEDSHIQGRIQGGFVGLGRTPFGSRQ